MVKGIMSIYPSIIVYVRGAAAKGNGVRGAGMARIMSIGEQTETERFGFSCETRTGGKNRTILVVINLIFISCSCCTKCILYPIQPDIQLFEWGTPGVYYYIL